MNFIHTFYSKPLLSNKFNKYETLVDVIITDYTYSAYCCKKILGQNIILYADKLGAEILNNIPYDEVRILDFDSSIDFAASIKFEAIKDMTEDDVLIDGDLFLQNKKCLELINEYSKKYDYIYSFFEPYTYTLKDDANIDNLKNYNLMVDKMREREELFKEPYILPSCNADFCWPNTSFMKFNNMELKQKYLEQYHFFKKGLEGLDFGKAWPDIIIEQYHMKKLLEYGNYSSKAMIENFPTNESNKYALQIGFTHLGYCKININRMIKKFFIEKFGNHEMKVLEKQIEKWVEYKNEQQKDI